jgi:putative membrane protein
MLLELIIAIFIGVIAGTITGLIPGVHINLVGSLLLASIALLSAISPLYLAIFVISMSIAHTFIDFIPSVYLGCPDTDTELSILPGHEMLKEGNGHEAVLISILGSLVAVLSIIILSPLFIFIFPKIQSLIQEFIPFALIIIMFIMVAKESNKFQAVLVILLSGFLGYLVLNSDIRQPLLPLLSGLFGASSLIISIKQKSIIPVQDISKKIKNVLSKREIFSSLSSSIIFAPLCGFLPGLGSGQAAILSSQFHKVSQKQFMFILGSTNTIVMIISFIALYTIHRVRSGSAATIQALMPEVSIPVAVLIGLSIIISSILSAYIGIMLSIFLANKMHKYNYSKISLSIIVFLSALIILISGFKGLFIFIISGLTGLYAVTSNVKRTHLMSSIIIPVIIFYLL